MLSFPDQNILSSLQAVEVSHEPKQIKILGQTDINTHGIQDTTNNSYKRTPPLTLLDTFTEITKAQILWVGSHQDKDTPWNNIADLLDLKLSLEATLNVLCDKMAMEACLSNHSDPDVNVMPTEKWALLLALP